MKRAFGRVDIFLTIFKVLITTEVLVLTFVWILLFASMVLDKKYIERSDFFAFYTAGLMVRSGEIKKIYDIPTQLKYQSQILGKEAKSYPLFRYLPFAAPVFYPFTFFNFYEAFFLLLVVNVILIIFMIIISKKTFKNLTRFKLWFLLPFSYYPIILTLVKGQVSIFLALVLLLIYRLLSKRPLIAGILFSFLLIKPHFFLAGLPFFFLITKDKKNFLLGVFLASLFLFLLSVVLVGFKELLQFPFYTLSSEVNLRGIAPEVIVNVDLFLIFTPIVRYLSQSPWYTYLYGLTLYLIVLLIYAKKLNTVSYKYLYFSAVIFLVIFSYHTYPYDYALLLVPLMGLFGQAFGRKKTSLTLSILVILLLIFPNVQLMGSSLLNPLMLLTTAFFLLFGKHKTEIG